MSNPTTAGGSEEAPVQSVDRAVAILELLAANGEMGVTEIAAALGVHKSTAFRLLSVLERRGLSEQVSERGKYRLGFRMVVLAHAAARQLDITQLARPVCEWLAEQVGETVNLAVLDGDAAVNVVQVRGTKAVSSHNWIGQRTPLHATSSGKVLLASLEEERRRALYKTGLPALTPRTVCDEATLQAELERVRAEGYAYTIEELEEGLNALAAPVRSDDGAVVAAISVSAPSYRMGLDAIHRLAELVVKAADEVGAQLGGLG